MKVVHILSEHRHVIVLLHLSDQLMAQARLGSPQLTAHAVVETRHKVRISQPTIVRSHLLDRIILPQAVTATESLKTTLHRHTGTSQKHNFLSHFFLTVKLNVKLYVTMYITMYESPYD